MMHKSMLIVLALLGLSVSVPGQSRRDADRVANRSSVNRVAGVQARPAARISPRRTAARRVDGQRRSRSIDRGRNRVIRNGVGVARAATNLFRSVRRVAEGRRGPVVRDGYYKTVRERVWVPGYDNRVHVPAVYDYRYDSCGNRIRVLVREAYYRNDRIPGCWQWQDRRVWVPARY